ncbi:MAG: transglutaminase-like domain-containing protein [Candidatus Woesearchaeota archaeon]
MMYRIRKYLAYKQFIPTKKDLDCEKLKELTNQLKTKTFDETLVNIAEWQDRNIKYWDERGGIINYILIVSITILSIIIGNINNFAYFLLLLIPFLIIGKETLNIIFNIIILGVSLLLPFVFLILTIPSITISSNFLILFIALSFILGAFISSILSIYFKYRNIKRFIPDFDMGDTFKLSLPVEKILKYRLSICRDYAKLTAALLLSIYPKNEVYFLLIPSHVAVGIKKDNNIFVIDQKLPILTFNSWKEKWKKRFNKKRLNIEIFKIYLKNKDIEIQPIKEKNIIEQKTILDIKKLNKNLSSLLNIDEVKEKKKPSLEIPIKNILPLIQNEELIEKSLFEFIKNKIEDELVGNIKNLKGIHLEKRNDDLIIKLWLKI